MSSINTRLADIHQQISAACAIAGRDPDSVGLLAVSKTRPIGDIQAAAAAGQKDFGENYLQEALTKTRLAPELRWHFIGSIQSNKTRDIANHFNWVHSVASQKVARRLSEQRDPNLGKLNVLLQVNVSGEASKSGVRPDELADLVDSVLSMQGISLRGLMALPTQTEDPGLQRQEFAMLRQLRDRITGAFSLASFDQLSMGMTGDFPVAIEEGATWVRIGTAIFGKRPAKT